MTEEERLTLLHAEIDGDLTGDLRVELAQLLLAEPQTRALRDELRRVENHLTRLGEIEPPLELKDAIMRRLPAETAPTGTRSRWITGRWQQAALFAGLLTATAIVYQSLRGPDPGSSETAGTMAVGTAAVLDSVALGDGPVTGHASLYREGSGLALALEVTAAQPVDVIIASAGHSLRINGLAGEHADAAVHQTVALPGMETGGQDVELTFLMGERVVSRAKLRAPLEH
jgi:hypothetical protein